MNIEDIDWCCSEEEGHIFTWISDDVTTTPDPEMRCDCGKTKYGKDK